MQPLFSFVDFFRGLLFAFFQEWKEIK